MENSSTNDRCEMGLPKPPYTQRIEFFERDRKYNWVDTNNVFVGFDSDSSCCEDYGWFVVETEAEAEVRDPDHRADFADWDGYVFDPSYFKSINVSTDCGGRAAFRIVRGADVRYLVVFNYHNGYYSHGFTMHVDGVLTQEDYL